MVGRKDICQIISQGQEWPPFVTRFNATDERHRLKHDRKGRACEEGRREGRKEGRKKGLR